MSKKPIAVFFTKTDHFVAEYESVESKLNKMNLHREDGPAIQAVYFDEWWLNGVRHREDGPAYIGKDGEERYRLFGKKLTKKVFAEYVNGTDEEKLLWKLKYL